jgi:hypothetical protein
MSDNTTNSTPAPEADPAWTMTAADGTTGTTPTPEDRQLLGRAQALLAATPAFRALSAPRLTRLEVNQGVASSENGYLYLRYEVDGATPQEFWTHWGRRDHVGWTTGQISVARGPSTSTASD